MTSSRWQNVILKSGFSGCSSRSLKAELDGVEAGIGHLDDQALGQELGRAFSSAASGIYRCESQAQAI